MDVVSYDEVSEDTNQPEEVSQEEKMKKEIEEQLTNEDVHWLDSIDFGALYRVYGRPGVWLFGSSPNRSRMLQMRPFLSPETKPIITNLDKLKPLELEYSTGLKIGEDEDERDVTLKDLFFCIDNYIESFDTEDKRDEVEGDLRDITKEQVYGMNLIPEMFNDIGADDDDIPTYQAVRIIKLYFTLKDRYDKFIEKEIADAKKAQEEKQKAGDEIQNEEG